MMTYRIVVVVETDPETAKDVQARLSEVVESMASDYATKPIQFHGVFMGADD